jgi:hypothetical protein
VDRHHIDADPDPEPNFYFVADPDPDADKNPTSSFTHVGKTECFLLLFIAVSGTV